MNDRKMPEMIVIVFILAGAVKFLGGSPQHQSEIKVNAINQSVPSPEEILLQNGEALTPEDSPSSDSESPKKLQCEQMVTFLQFLPTRIDLEATNAPLVCAAKPARQKIATNGPQASLDVRVRPDVDKLSW